MKTRFVIILFLFFALVANAQSDKSGFIAPTDSLARMMQGENIFYLPEDGFTLYGSPNVRDSIGMIVPLSRNKNAIKPPKIRDLTNATIHIIGSKPTIISGYDYAFKTYDDCFHIHFLAQENGFIKVLNDYNENLWIKMDEVTAKEFELKSWIDLYGKNGMIITTFPNAKIKLLQSPYSDAEVIIEIDEDYFEIKVTYFDEQDELCCEGLFCYVTATQFKVHPCYGGSYDKGNIIKIHQGWIRVIDQDGKRLIMHNAGGC